MLSQHCWETEKTNRDRAFRKLRIYLYDPTDWSDLLNRCQRFELLLITMLKSFKLFKVALKNFLVFWLVVGYDLLGEAFAAVDRYRTVLQSHWRNWGKKLITIIRHYDQGWTSCKSEEVQNILLKGNHISPILAMQSLNSFWAASLLRSVGL